MTAPCPSPVDEKTHHDGFYEVDARRIHAGALFRRAQRRVRRVLHRQLPLAGSVTVLSVGCGDGWLECAMAGRCGHITGVDLSSVAVESARLVARERGIANVTFLDGDIRGLPIPAGTFDVIWAIGFLHHLAEAAQSDLLADCLRWLRPGGTFVSIDPSARRFVGAFQRLFARQARRYRSPDERELDPTRLAALVHETGFAGVRTVHYDFFLSPLAWVLPGLPPPLAVLCDWLDELLIAVPGLSRWGSSFAVLGRKAPLD